LETIRSDFKNLSTLTNLLFASVAPSDFTNADDFFGVNRPLYNEDVFAIILMDLGCSSLMIAVDFADGSSFEGLIIFAI
jgi:hypothetical protein